MKLKTILFILFPILLITYLLWPLGTDFYTIEFDQSDVERKKEWLSVKDTSSYHELPNILWIVVDDLGMADLSLYGLSEMETPNMDKIGKEGVTFTNAFTTSPVCSPARAALLTGRYPQRFGFQFQMHDRYLKNRLEYLGFKYFVKSKPWEPKWMNEVPRENDIELQGIPPSEIILPELLKKRGYGTGLIGKWHLGGSEKQLPCELGFDYQYGFFASHSLYIQENTAGYSDQKIPEDFTDKYIWEGQRDGQHAIYRNCQEIEEKGYLTDRFTEEAIQFVNNQSNDQPFFLMLSYNAPHTPLQASNTYIDQFSHIKDPIKRTYYAMIKNLDDNVGKLMHHLDSSGLTENTVIFFVSDNGGAEYTFTTDNGPYIGGKITDFEGGIRIPFAMKWKGKIPEGIEYEPQVSIMDIFQTSAHIAQVALPNFIPMDGVNLLDFLDQENKNPPHPYLYWQRGTSKAIRSQNWKTIWNEEKKDTLLFDLKSAPFESINVLEVNKNISNEMISVHNNWSSAFPKPLWPSLIYFKHSFDGEEFYFDQ